MERKHELLDLSVPNPPFSPVRNIVIPSAVDAQIIDRINLNRVWIERVHMQVPSRMLGIVGPRFPRPQVDTEAGVSA
jgi:hypothetical protein